MSTPRIRFQLATLAVCRFFMTTTMRIVFAFLPTFARGLGVSEARMQASLSSRSLVALAVPLLIPLSEKFGRKPFLYLSLIVFSTGCFLAYSARSLLIFIIALFITSLATALYDPTMRSHLGDVVPYAQRGKAVAVTEFSWAGALLIGAPLAGWLIARNGWQTPFVWLGLLGLLGIVLLWRMIPNAAADATERLDYRAILTALRTQPALWGAALYVGFTMFGNIMVFSTYAGWMERQFDVAVGGLGVAAMVIGGAELLGETLAGWSSDRFGKRRMVLLSAVASALFYVLLPLTAQSLVLASVMLFALFVTFEMSFICVVPIFTELMPQARSIPLAILAIVPPLSRAGGLLVIGLVGAEGRFLLIGIVAGLLALIGSVVFGRTMPKSIG